MRRLPRATALATAAAFLFAIHGERLRMVECLHDALAATVAGASHSHHQAPDGGERAPAHGACLCLGLCHTSAAPVPPAPGLDLAPGVAPHAQGFRPLVVHRPALLRFALPFAHAPPIRLG